MSRYQHEHVYEAFSAFHVQYYQTELRDGQRMRIPKKTKIEWKGLYSGRRGACTAVIDATGENYAVAQALLRHKSMTTALNVYKKAITPTAFRSGMNSCSD